MRKRRSAQTVAGFRAALPGATDLRLRQQQPRPDARGRARRPAPSSAPSGMQGKGHVVRRMFADVDADIYVMADGDLTYDPKAAPAMVEHAARRAARHGRRHPPARGQGRLSRRPCARQPAVHRPARRGLFGRSFSDIFSGYRVFSRRFVKSFPVLSDGLRDRDRNERPRARAEDAGRRGRDRLWRPAGGLGIEAFDLPRRLADPEDHRHPVPDRAAGSVLRRRSARCCWSPRIDPRRSRWS